MPRNSPHGAALPSTLQAYSFLERKRDAAAAQEACEAGPGGGTCGDLEKLNDMAHELLMTGSVSALGGEVAFVLMPLDSC